MSTINQAMLKAERERAGEVSPAKGIAPRLAGTESATGITGARGAARPRNSISLEPMRKGIRPLQADSFEIEDHTSPRSVFAVRSWMLGVVGLLAVTIGFVLAPGSETVRPAAKADESPLQEAIDPVRAVAQAPNASYRAPVQYQDVIAPPAPARPDPIVVRVEIEPPAYHPSTVMAGGQTTSYFAERSPTVHASPATDAQAPAPPSPRFQLRPEAQLSRYRLEGIFWDEINPGAIINDRIVEAGDRIDALTIKEIRKSSVIVEISGVEMELQ